MKIYLSPSDQSRNMYAGMSGVSERDTCRRIADALQKALERCGFEVCNNQTDSMIDRVKQSNAWGADLHIPLHTNACNGKVGGTRIFTYSATSKAVPYARAIYQALAPITPGISDNMTTYPTLYELRMTKAKAVYVETEFHDVPQYAQWIVDNVANIAETICKAICEAAGVKYIGAETKGKLYTVQVGAFAVYANAKAMSDKLTADGYNNFVTEKER